MSDDIVTTLRRNPLYIPTSRINSFGTPQMGFELTSFNLIAADEIEQLRRDYSAAEKDHCDYVKKYYNAKVEIERLREELKRATNEH